MSGSFTQTEEKHHYYGEKEEGGASIRFTPAERAFARKRFDRYQAAVDVLWNEMYDDIQQETEFDDPEVYLLIQKIRTTRR